MFVVLLVVRVDQVMAFLRFPRYLYDAILLGATAGNKSRTHICVSQSVGVIPYVRRLCVSIAYSWTRSSKCAPASMRHNSNWTTPSLLRDPLRSLPIVANLLTCMIWDASTQRLRSTQVDATFAYVRKIFKET